MGFLGEVSGRQLVGASLCFLLLGLGVACGTAQKNLPDAPPEDGSGPPPPCRKDEVREYLCDDLVPFSPENAAPEPYQTCPGSLGIKGNTFPPTSSLARFDAARTQSTRKRVAPGHACCYSWCSTLAVADANLVDPASCQQPNAMHEKLCISTAEGGVSDAAAPPNEGCANAVTPPPGVAFTPPKAAALDLQATADKRVHGVSECCYAWCSRAPLGTGLGRR